MTTTELVEELKKPVPKVYDIVVLSSGFEGL